MSDNQTLLEILSEPGFHSGTRLGEELGISRVAIKKRLQILADKGLPVRAVHGKGYCLENGVVLLSEDKIKAGLSEGVLAQMAEFHLLQNVGSTNEFLAKQAFSNDAFDVCVAEAQAAGRGRRGRQWVSSPFRNIILSLSWQFKQWPETISGLGLAASLIVAERLKADYGLDVDIKWPNDLLVDGAKLAGVLVDVAGESGGTCRVVLGLGLNVSQLEKPQGLDYPIQDMSGLGLEVDRNQLLASIIEGWVDMLGDFSVLGFEPFQSRWNALSGYFGKNVVLTAKNESRTGVMKGVDIAGALLLEDEAGNISRVVDSSVSMRLK